MYTIKCSNCGRDVAVGLPIEEPIRLKGCPCRNEGAKAFLEIASRDNLPLLIVTKRPLTEAKVVREFTVDKGSYWNPTDESFTAYRNYLPIPGSDADPYYRELKKDLKLEGKYVDSERSLQTFEELEASPV